jgi:hypothetical protein
MFTRNGGQGARWFVAESDHVQSMEPAQIRMRGFLEQKDMKATVSGGSFLRYLRLLLFAFSFQGRSGRGFLNP